jgi:transcriptional regulator with XRE-family HTH domain
MMEAVLSFNPMETDDPLAPLNDTERTIGRNMRRIREKLELTQQEVAERMLKSGFRFHQTQIAKMERGERPIRVNEWIAIARALGVSIDALTARGPATDDRLFEAKLIYERMRIMADDLGRQLHEVGVQYEQVMTEFLLARQYYYETAVEFGVEPEDPHYMLVHETAEKLKRMESTGEYFEGVELEGKLSDITPRILREGPEG